MQHFVIQEYSFPPKEGNKNRSLADLFFNFNEKNIICEAKHGMQTNPVKIEFSGENRAMHYCRTGESVDEFVVMRLSFDKLIAVKYYRVTSTDVGSAWGDCSKFIKSVDFSNFDKTHEIRFR